VKEVALDISSDATSVMLEDINDGEGAPYYLVTQVLDKRGNVLWDDASASDDFADDFAHHTPALDRDPALVTAAGRDKWVHELR
jgi:hypothetical protein